MKIEPNENIPGSGMKRQLYMMSNLGLFYIILIALFGIPLLGTFVVVLIKGVLDLRYAIMGAGAVVLVVAAFFLGRFGWRRLRRMRANGREAFRDAAGYAHRGQPFQIELFNGLMSVSYGGRRHSAVLPAAEGPVALLPDLRDEDGCREPPRDPAGDPIERLRALVELKKEGIIDEAEFLALKKRLIQDACREAPDGPMPPGAGHASRPHGKDGAPMPRPPFRN